MLRYAGGARGSLWASQVAVGEANEVRLRIYGTAGGLDWCQRDANRLAYTPIGGVRQILTRNGAGTGDVSRRASRVPAGHPEGYLEGFATIYSDAADAIMAARDGSVPQDPDFPSVEDGVAGLAFIDAAVRSSAGGGAWTPLF